MIVSPTKEFKMDTSTVCFFPVTYAFIQSEKDLIFWMNEYGKWKRSSCQKLSNKDFDIVVEGVKLNGVVFKSWFPLAFIGMMNWIKYADLTDYPEIVRKGDWSGIRDSEEETIWKIFDTVRSDLILERLRQKKILTT
jgi:hypothetical protein